MCLQSVSMSCNAVRLAIASNLSRNSEVIADQQARIDCLIRVIDYVQTVLDQEVSNLGHFIYETSEDRKIIQCLLRAS